ncbi:MAG: PadR family transcriptional regulator [Anaerolineae bacterium]|nr:PadR family transcriptional regulator [Anaerolineae bacterium]
MTRTTDKFPKANAMLKYALLGLLNYAPMSGYDLEQFINHSITHFWHAKLSQIYRTLKQMEAEGLVTSEMQEQEQHRSKRVYTITQMGADDLQRWLKEYSTELDDLKLPFLLRTFFYGQAPAEQIQTQMRLWHDLHTRQLDLYRHITPSSLSKFVQEMEITPDDQFFWEATRRFGEMYEAMCVQWLDEMMAELAKRRDS